MCKDMRLFLCAARTRSRNSMRQRLRPHVRSAASCQKRTVVAPRSNFVSISAAPLDHHGTNPRLKYSSTTSSALISTLVGTVRRLLPCSANISARFNDSTRIAVSSTRTHRPHRTAPLLPIHLLRRRLRRLAHLRIPGLLHPVLPPPIAPPTLTRSIVGNKGATP